MTNPTPSFKKFGAKPATTAPAAPVQEAVKVHEPEVQKPAAAPVVPEVTQVRAITAFGGMSSVGSAITAFTQVADEKPSFDLFPLVNVLGGATGGGFDAAKHQAEDLKQLLPSGRKPIKAVFLGYRVIVTAYPLLYDAARKDKPSWLAAIPSHDGDAMTVATKLCRNYQFTKKTNKGKFNFDSSNVGHVKPAVEVLVYLPEANMLCTVRGTNDYTATERTMREISAHVASDGSIQPFACAIEVESNREGEETANPWLIHHMRFLAIPPKDAATWKAGFDGWVAAASEDAETVENYQKWLGGSDKPLTDDILQRMASGANL